MKPYFETKLGKLYHGDCLKIMPLVGDVGLVLTDPPYGVRKKETWDAESYFMGNIDKWLSQCLSMSKRVVWFCAGKMLPHILSGREDEFHRILIWDKPIGSQYAGAMHSNLWYSIEPILVFGEPTKTDKAKRYGFSTFQNRTIPHKAFGHPTTKPINLIYELAYYYSNEDEIVLDPFLGSGTTAVACEQLNRHWIGIEISEKYCEIAAKRIERERQQLKLFAPEPPRPKPKQVGLF